MSLPRKNVDSTVKANLTSSQQTGQTQSHPMFDREPLVSEIPDQGFVLATVTGTTYVYTRIGSDRFKVALTAV